MLGWLSFIFFLVGFMLAYWFWVRPMLRERPQFKDFYDRTDSFWLSVKLKFTTLRTKLAAGMLMVASTLVELHDFVLPAATGIDWTPITSTVPPVVWPVVSFGAAALFFWLRNLTAKRQEQVVQAVAGGMAPEQAAVMIPSDTAGPGG